MAKITVFMLLSCFLVYGQQPPQPGLQHRKLEYKHSFKGPNLSQRDGTIPFWEISGDASASSEQLRLAPSIRSKQGMAWNVKPMLEAEFWDVELTFKITGQGRIGADGLALWYTAVKGSAGSVFGANDRWTGLGLFFDSFDNDGQRNNPYVMVMLNDGTRDYDHMTDGMQQQLSGCQKDFRNKPYPVKARIEYNKNVLTVLIHDGMTPQPRYELCIRAENVFLPRSGYFGLSAATGGLADDHDVLGFLVTSINPVSVQPTAAPITDAERKRLEEEFQRQQQQFDQEREKFMKEHPDKARKDDDMSKVYEDAASRELRLIYEGQSIIHTAVAALDAKLTQLLQQQQQQTALVSQIAQRPVPQGGVPAAPSAGGVGLQQHEVNEIFTLLRESHAYVRDSKSYITDIHAKVAQLEQRIQAQGQGHVQQVGGGAANQFELQTVKTYLEGIKHDVEQVRVNTARQQQPCPASDTKCVSTTLFLVAVVAQTVLLVMYWLLKGGQEKAKFY